MNNRKNRRGYSYSESSRQTNKKIPKTSSNSIGDTSTTTSEDAPELPGFYYDHAKQKYFKIGSNNFGVASVVTSQSIAKKSEDEEFSNLNKHFKKSNNSNILNTLTFAQLKGYNSSLKINLKDYLIKTSRKQNLYSNPYDTFITNKIREIQAVQISNDEILLLENSSIDMNLYYSSVKKFRLSDLDKLTNEKKIDVTSMGIENNFTGSRSFTESSHTKMYFHNPELFVRSDKCSLEIQLWKATEAKDTIFTNFNMPVNVPCEILCSALSNQKINLGFPYKILVGSEQKAALVAATSIGNYSGNTDVILNTRSSAAYCVSFSNSVCQWTFRHLFSYVKN